MVFFLNFDIEYICGWYSLKVNFSPIMNYTYFMMFKPGILIK